MALKSSITTYNINTYVSVIRPISAQLVLSGLFQDNRALFYDYRNFIEVGD